MENDIFWSDIGSGFKEPGDTLNSQYPVVPRQEKGVNGKVDGGKKGEVCPSINCKTVRIFKYSITREQSNKRSETRLKTDSKTGRTCETLRTFSESQN